MLSSKGDIVRRWKEYFEDLLNATDTPSLEEVQLEVQLEVEDLPTTRLKLLTLSKNFGGKIPEVNESYTQFMKAFDVLGCFN